MFYDISMFDDISMFYASLANVQTVKVPNLSLSDFRNYKTSWVTLLVKVGMGSQFCRKYQNSPVV